ncbi:Bug family tripartite tricarboxylate transporter substrate binding protein [Acidovorax sp. NCPPB 4044]|uniref:Bug family tripartite tricarboxylate transporter substrate binding protein n=1 Tax=Acidovorax sp. NCPPB 4044 TaxID=2940490 RepID=UPI0023043B04|nr:tripartite tricarboxylate transporter substrate-binding protein [Acidovorax sp. NCPPB 4044]MDA8523449.1 tripartite tricarboxylate transporter substrate-binding protein [Acidovorax sp. NCPPB 4044]
MPHRYTPPVPARSALRRHAAAASPARRLGLRAAFAALAAATAALAPLQGARAQPQDAAAAYPTKPITIVVGYPPGGSTDLTARTLATELSTRLGVPVVIENIGGAGGAIGAQKVASSAPDGYTLLVGASNEIAINRLVTKKVKYDIKDFTALALIGSQPLVLVASTGSGVKSAADFVQRVRSQPGKASYGSSGVGTALHLAGEMVKEQGQLFMTHIPYRGVAPLANDLLGNNIEYGVFVLSSGLPHIRSGKLVALGTTEARRSAVAPEIPALAELPQFKNVDIGVWFALMGPAGLPRPVAERLRRATRDALQSPDFRKKMEASGGAVASPTVDTDAFLASEVAKYRKIVEFARIEE